MLRSRIKYVSSEPRMRRLANRPDRRFGSASSAGWIIRMEGLFSTKDVQPLDRFPYWHDVACRYIVQHDCLPECQTAFQAVMQGGIVADIDFIVFENSAMQVRRTSGQISHAT